MERIYGEGEEREKTNRENEKTHVPASCTCVCTYHSTPLQACGIDRSGKKQEREQMHVICVWEIRCMRYLTRLACGLCMCQLACLEVLSPETPDRLRNFPQTVRSYHLAENDIRESQGLRLLNMAWHSSVSGR